MTRISQHRAHYKPIAVPVTPKPKPFEEMINQAIAATGIDPDDFYANINGDTLSLLTTVAEMPQSDMTSDYAKRLVKIFPSTTLEQWCEGNPSPDTQSASELTSFLPDWKDSAHNTIQDYMVEHKISPEEMASRLGISLRGLISIFADEVQIDKSLAQTLSEVCGNSPEFWLKRQAQAYQRREPSPIGKAIFEWMEEYDYISSEMADNLEISTDDFIQVVYGDRPLDKSLTEKLITLCSNSPRFLLRLWSIQQTEQDSLTDTQTAIAEECDKIKALLLSKNKLYGNSALTPVRIFSKSSPIEQINVRIDDKLSRLASEQIGDTEDTELDLIGYLVLKRVALLLHASKHPQDKGRRSPVKLNTKKC